MNTIVMVTLVGSTLVGSAQFSNFNECMAARQQMVAQKGVTATCVYRHKKQDNSGKIFGAMLEAMKAMADTTKCGTMQNENENIFNEN